MHRLFLLVAALGLAVVAGCGGSGSGDSTSAQELPEFQITGSWSGELHQQDLQPFEVTATIGDLDDPAANTVHYSGIDCGGNWTYLGRSVTAYRFREVIDRGAGGSCKGTGLVTLTPVSQDVLAYEFRGGGIESRGRLARAG